MKLYKQIIEDSGVSADPLLIAESESIDNLKKEAQKLAAIDGCIEYAWLSGSDSNPPYQFPYELTANDVYRFVIREW